jgi:hypothetical protein
MPELKTPRISNSTGGSPKGDLIKFLCNTDNSLSLTVVKNGTADIVLDVICAFDNYYNVIDNVKLNYQELKQLNTSGKADIKLEFPTNYIIKGKTLNLLFIWKNRTAKFSKGRSMKTITPDFIKINVDGSLYQTN